MYISQLSRRLAICLAEEAEIIEKGHHPHHMLDHQYHHQHLHQHQPFFSLFLMRKQFSSGQKWFLRSFFPLIRGMFVSVTWVPKPLFPSVRIRIFGRITSKFRSKLAFLVICKNQDFWPNKGLSNVPLGTRPRRNDIALHLYYFSSKGMA